MVFLDRNSLIPGSGYDSGRFLGLFNPSSLCRLSCPRCVLVAGCLGEGTRDTAGVGGTGRAADRHRRANPIRTNSPGSMGSAIIRGAPIV